MPALGCMGENYWPLALAGFGVGTGEAGGTPPSPSMLGGKVPPARRPMANTIFALGACLGAWLGSQVAGEVAERGGWRAAFLVLGIPGDRKSTRLNSSHSQISYAVFCLKKKKQTFSA